MLFRSWTMGSASGPDSMPGAEKVRERQVFRPRQGQETFQDCRAGCRIEEGVVSRKPRAEAVDPLLQMQAGQQIRQLVGIETGQEFSGESQGIHPRAPFPEWKCFGQALPFGGAVVGRQAIGPQPGAEDGPEFRHGRGAQDLLPQLAVPAGSIRVEGTVSDVDKAGVCRLGLYPPIFESDNSHLPGRVRKPRNHTGGFKVYDGYGSLRSPQCCFPVLTEHVADCQLRSGSIYYTCGFCNGGVGRPEARRLSGDCGRVTETSVDGEPSGGLCK